MNFKPECEALLREVDTDYTIVGILTREHTIYPLGTDTKVLSTVFESFARPIVYRIAGAHGFDVWEPEVQNSYPDFTLLRSPDDPAKIAVDVKTTYADRPDAKIKFTLGGYTSFLRKETKNIEFPYSQYAKHWIIGYVYRRTFPTERRHLYALDDIDHVPPPYQGVDVFVQEKWRIAGDKAGSGNTTNIGSIRGTVADFKAGNGVFTSYEEYLDYWRNYGVTAAARKGRFKNIVEYRHWRG